MNRESDVETVEVVQVIRVVSLFGAGVVGNPYRTITQYFDMQGVLLATDDPQKTHVRLSVSVNGVPCPP